MRDGVRYHVLRLAAFYSSMPPAYANLAFMAGARLFVHPVQAGALLPVAP
jgi:hypothetical protein